MEQHPHNEQKVFNTTNRDKENFSNKRKGKGKHKKWNRKNSAKLRHECFWLLWLYRLRAFPRRAVCLDLKCVYTPSSVKKLVHTQSKPPAKPEAWVSPIRALYRQYPLRGPERFAVCISFSCYPLRGSFYVFLFSRPVNGSTTPISCFICPYISILRCFGANTMWYWHLQLVCSKLFMSLPFTMKTSLLL